jgi:hypothetical protein
VRAEDAACDLHAFAGERLAEVDVDRIRLLGTSRVGERRPVPLGGVLQSSSDNRHNVRETT